MRPIIDMDTVQIEITNACHNRCSNCTRLIGHHRSPYFMGMMDFEGAVSSLAPYPKMTGVMGGEPLLHPKFEEMCRYLSTRIPKERCGLWTCFPKGYEKYREVIANTFGNIFLNDHTRSDILHSPILVHPDDTPLERWAVRYYQHHCWVQNSWSACINPRGAFFCEIAGALSMLTREGRGWDVEVGWWTRSPIDFTSQISRYCSICGAALPIMKRESTDGRDDVSPIWVEKLRTLGSPRLARGDYVLYSGDVCSDQRQIATYKDQEYRDAIADRYGMFLVVNERGFHTPHLKRKWKGEESHGQEERQEDQQHEGENCVCASPGIPHPPHRQGEEEVRVDIQRNLSST